MKISCLVIIISVISLAVSLGTFMCVLQKEQVLINAKDFHGWVVAVLSVIIAILLGWNVITTINIQQQWEETRKDISTWKKQIDSLKKIRYESRANNQYTSACVFLIQKEYGNAINSALQCINNMLPLYVQNEKLDNFSKINDIINLSIYENGVVRNIEIGEELYVKEVINCIKNQYTYSCLDKDLKNNISIVEQMVDNKNR